MNLCNETITIYNHYIDSTTKSPVYLPTVIDGVHWFGVNKSVPNQNGLVSAEEYTIRIPLTSNFSGKRYTTKKSFNRLNDRTRYFTITEGDVIVRGSHALSNVKPSYLESEFDDVITVVSVTDNTQSPNAPHWKVVCK